MTVTTVSSSSTLSAREFASERHDFLYILSQMAILHSHASRYEFRSGSLFDIISARSLNQNHCVAQRLSKGDAISMSNNPTTHSVINLAAVTIPTVTDIRITVSSTIIKRTVTTGARRCITSVGYRPERYNSGYYPAAECHKPR